MNYPFSTFRIQLVFQNELFRHHESFIREQILKNIYEIASVRSVRILEVPDSPGYLSALIKSRAATSDSPGTPYLFGCNQTEVHEPLIKGYFSWKSYGGFSFKDHLMNKGKSPVVQDSGTTETWLIGEILSYLASFNAAYEEDLWLNLEFCVLKESFISGHSSIQLEQAVTRVSLPAV